MSEVGVGHREPKGEGGSLPLRAGAELWASACRGRKRVGWEQAEGYLRLTSYRSGTFSGLDRLRLIRDHRAFPKDEVGRASRNSRLDDDHATESRLS